MTCYNPDPGVAVSTLADVVRDMLPLGYESAFGRVRGWRDVVFALAWRTRRRFRAPDAVGRDCAGFVERCETEADMARTRAAVEAFGPVRVVVDVMNAGPGILVADVLP